MLGVAGVPGSGVVGIGPGDGEGVGVTGELTLGTPGSLAGKMLPATEANPNVSDVQPNNTLLLMSAVTP